jgi:hypothetical protein
VARTIAATWYNPRVLHKNKHDTILPLHALLLLLLPQLLLLLCCGH